MSSATTGFFQQLPSVLPQYDSSRSDDDILPRILALYLPQPLPPQINDILEKIARDSIAPSTLRHVIDAETNTPTLYALDTFGRENGVDPLHTSNGWQRLKDIGIRAGSVALGYSLPDGSPASFNSRVAQFAVNYLWSPSAALVTCPAAMTDGAAMLLGSYLKDADGDQPGRAGVLSRARERLISYDPAVAWTSGQWMTERTGGSDVSGTETAAVRPSQAEMDREREEFESDRDGAGEPLGPWRIDGFKWFSSATDADVVVMLAKTPKGLSAFYAPMKRMRKNEAIMNGVRITRLKEKLGTKALPTAELEIKGMRGWLLGKEGKGVKEITTILNTTRLWTAIGSVAGWARGLAIAKAFARVRKVRGKLLVDNPQHVKWMADETVKCHAAVHLAFLGAALNGIADSGPRANRGTTAEGFLPSTDSDAQILLRALTPVMKAQCSVASVHGVRACMESLGGVGYCENNGDGGLLNLARLYRDVNVNPIWEGTVSVMAEDVVRVLKSSIGGITLESLGKYVHRLLQGAGAGSEMLRAPIVAEWEKFSQRVQATSAADLLYDGRQLLYSLESVFCACLLVYNAGATKDRVDREVARRWVEMRFPGAGEVLQSMAPAEARELDGMIFLGASSQSRLNVHL